MEGATAISLVFYLGNRKDTQHPNRKIAQRVINFPRPAEEGDEVAIQAFVNEANIITIKAWFLKDPSEVFQVTTDLRNPRVSEKSASRMVAKKLPVYKKGTQTITKVHINDYYNTFCNIQKTYDNSIKRIFMEKIRSFERTFKDAENLTFLIDNLILRITGHPVMLICWWFMV